MPVNISRTLAKLVFPDKPRGLISRYGVAIALPVLSIFISNSVFTLSRAPFFPLFTLCVMFAAVFGGWGAGIVATLVSIFVNVVALPPKFSLVVTTPDDVLRLIVFGVGGLLVSLFVATIGSVQQKLEVEREQLRVTLASIGDAVMATDTSGQITFMNAVAEQATGWVAEEALGLPLEDVLRIVNESTRMTVDNPVRKVFESGRIVGLANHTLLIRRDGTEIPIDDSAAPILDARGKIQGAVLVFRDITQQKQSDAALLHAEKLASVGRLAATIAHEINNPLESISNLLYLIKATRDWTEVEQYATSAEHQLSRAAEVTKQTLSFARREDRYEQVIIGGLVDGVLALYSNKIQGKHVSVLKRCMNDASVLATKSEVRQVLGNLIGNALDALPQGGTLHLRVRQTQCAGRPVTRIVVADNGHGIPFGSPAESLRRVFHYEGECRHWPRTMGNEADSREA